MAKKYDGVKRPNIFWYCLERIIEFFYFLFVKVKITRINCKGLKGPYLVIGSHSSFADFPMCNRATNKRLTWVVSVEEFVGRAYVMHSIGSISKHKFTNEVQPVKNIMTSIRRLNTCCAFFPEARFSLIGKNEPIDKALGKLAKTCKCPVVVMIMHGNFLRSPQWCKHPYRKVPLEAEMIQVASLEEVNTLSAEEIQKRIEDVFVYNDYQWQLQNKIKIKSKMRAHNIHKVLYQCPHCHTEHEMASDGTRLWCEHCGKSWTMNEYGQLIADDGKDIFTDPTEWYDWEFANVKEEVENGTYKFYDQVRVERLTGPDSKFVPLDGEATLTQDENGFLLEGTLEEKPFKLFRDGISMSSVHIEYDFKGRGNAIDLYDGKNSYWVYPINQPKNITKMHFAQIAIYNKLVNRLEK